MGKNDDQIHSLGFISKEEPLKTIEHKIKTNTLVLETVETYPGYHGENLPSDTKPEAIYIITEKEYPIEVIFRLSKKIKRFVSFNYDAIPAEIIINNIKYYGIRIRFIDSFDILSELQDWFCDEGISLMKRKSIDALAHINLKKIFILKKISEYIFKDLDEENTYYFEIPAKVNMSQFKKISANVKNNSDYSNFDAAKAYIYHNLISDYVRIYSKKINLNHLEEIRIKYVAEIKRNI